MPFKTNAGAFYQFQNPITNYQRMFLSGYNLYGQLGDGSTINKSGPGQVGSQKSWTQLALGNGHALSIKSDGSLWGWGDNIYGQLGTGDGARSVTSYSQIAGGSAHNIAIGPGGLLYGWGINNNGNLGNGTTVGPRLPVMVNQESWISVAAGHITSYAIKGDGILFAWGNNNYGQLGISNLVSATRSSPTQVGGSYVSVTAIRGGGTIYGGAFLLKADGTLWAFGKNDFGQLGTGDTIDRSSPVQISNSLGTTWLSVSAFAGTIGASAVGIDQYSSLWTWGENSIGQLGQGAIGHRSSPGQVGADGWKSVSAGQSFMAGINSADKLFTWGLNSTGQLGLGDLTTRNSPTQVGNSSWTQVKCTQLATHGFQSNGNLYGWGGGGYVGDSASVYRNSPVLVSNPSGGSSAVVNSLSVASTSWQYMYSASGYTAGWGANGGAFGPYIGANTNNLLLSQPTQIETATFTPYKVSPIQISTSSWSFIWAVQYSSYAIKKDGTLWAWGNNVDVLSGNTYFLGDGTTIARSSPIQIPGSWTQVNSLCGIQTDGTLWTWGLNGNGQLGLGDNVNRSTPTQITSPSSTWKYVYKTTYNSYMIDNNNALYAAGLNYFGQLANVTVPTGSYSNSKSNPIQVTGGGSWLRVVAADNDLYGHALAIKTDGTLWGWGINNIGQLSLSPLGISRSSPTQIGAASWTNVTAGGGMYSNDFTASLGIRSDGTLWAWGGNSYGQLGVGTTTGRSSMVQIASGVRSTYPNNIIMAQIRVNNIAFSGYLS
jgi:alpha-tubulin suppressor-like RCC1 family protein